MTKLVSLDGHRRHIEKRERRKCTSNLKRDARYFGSDVDIAGYALVVWDKDGTNTSASWHNPTLPIRYLPELCKSTLAQSVMAALGGKFTSRDED